MIVYDLTLLMMKRVLNNAWSGTNVHCYQSPDQDNDRVPIIKNENIAYFDPGIRIGEDPEFIPGTHGIKWE